MRPSVDHLIFQLKKHSALVDHPDAVTTVIQAIAHQFFVHERRRPSHALEALRYLDGVWRGALNYNSDRQLEMLQNAVTGDVSSEKLSFGGLQFLLGTDLHRLIDLYIERRFSPEYDPTKAYVGGDDLGLNQRAFQEETERLEVYMAQEGAKGKKRNNTTPGPSHKSPIAWKTSGTAGLTIPGIDGKFIWVGVGEPPDMTAALDKLLGGEGGRSPQIDLNDKKLKKRVRQIIWEHTYEAFEGGSPSCGCGATFEIGEEWAMHVRKLIWKELKSGNS